MGFFTKRKIKKTEQLLEQAISLNEEQNDEAINIYSVILKLRPDWSTPYYNLGLIYKYRGEWEKSFYNNQQSVKFDEANEAGWWNLGIAATALKRWRIAREAWHKCGVIIDINDVEPYMDFGNTPIRINPDANAETVWAKRIDPARAIILNIPLPSSGHKYGDMVLNDGAPQGYKIVNEKEYPILNELEIISRSNYKTYSCRINKDNAEVMIKLESVCKEYDIEVEDWSTIRYYCKQCSEGIIHENHDYELKERNDNIANIGFAATDYDLLKEALEKWKVITLCDYEGLVLELE